MKKITGLMLVGFALSSQYLFAQSFAENALLFSRSTPGGSARIQGMGGAQISLGGDFSSASSNPAGLGMYNKGEITFTPSFGQANLKSSYVGNSTTESKSGLSLPGFSIALHRDYDRSEGFLGGTFSITHSRGNDFTNTMTYEGTNTHNSINDYFINKANGRDPSQFAAPKNSNDLGGYLYNTLTELAYDNYLIGDCTVWANSNNPKQYFSDVTGSKPYQKETIESKGTQGQWNFAYGANISDKFFLGASLGFASLRYKLKKTFTEKYYDLPPISNMTMEENLDISGSGINFTVGGIMRPVDHLQVGLAISTPTAYQISDSYTASMSTHWNNYEYLPNTPRLNNLSASTDLLLADYGLSTPWKFSGGVTYFFGKHGLITADIEQMNYKNIKYSSTGSDSYISDYADEDNAVIKSSYKSTTNIRIGGEYRYNALRFRTGFNYMGDPYSDDQEVSHASTGFSGGFGYRTQGFSVDLAATYGMRKNAYHPYTVPSNSPLVTYQQRNTTVMITLGFPF